MGEPDIEVGRVAGPHGVAGKIRVRTHSGDPSGLLHARTLRLHAKSPGGEERLGDFEVRAASPRGGFAVVSLAGIDTPEDAKEWTGASVSVSRSQLPPPAEGEFYWVDLIGCEVVDETGNRVGEISGVEEGPAHDWIAVRRGEGESLLPMVSAFIREVDVPGRRVVVAPPEGW